MTTLMIECEGSPPVRVELPPGEYALGAEDSNAIVIEHPTVSSHHCDLFLQADGQVIVLDAGSTNGIWMAGESVGKAVLAPGQSFHAGEAKITVVMPAALPQPRRLPVAVPRPAVASAPSRTASAIPALAQSFIQELPDAFAYPFRGDAYLYIVIVVVLELIPALVPYILGPVGWVIGIVIGVYLVLLWQQIILSTIDGKDRFPDFPHVSLDWQENFSLYLRYVGLMWVCFSPVFICYVAKMWQVSVPLWLVCCCFGVSCLYFPMALLAFLITDSFVALNPVFIIRSMFVKLADYLVLVGLCALFFGGCYLLSRIGEPSMGGAASGSGRMVMAAFGALSEAIGLYLAFVWLRLLGLFYRHHKDRLDWY